MLGCTNPAPPYVYPTAQDQNVNYLCNIIYEPQYALFLLSARRFRVSKIVPVEDGLIAYFKNEKQVLLPINSGLPVGEEFYCRQRDSSYPCLLGDNRDSNCTRNRPRRVD